MATQLIYPKRIKMVAIALMALTIIGAAAVVQFLNRNERISDNRALMSKGASLANLIALHPIEDFRGKNRDVFLRTFREYLFTGDLLYCLVHDNAGNPIFSLDTQIRSSDIPRNVQTRSLQSLGLTTQSYQIKGIKSDVYEFSKPLMISGDRTGTVRIGFKSATAAFFSSDRISLMAMVTFLVFAAGAFVYYGLSWMIRPFAGLYERAGISMTDSGSGPGPWIGSGGFFQIGKGIERYVMQMNESLKNCEVENAQIAARLGTANFEKNQMLEVMDSLDFGIIVTDIHDHITLINRAMLTALDRQRDDAIHHLLPEIFQSEEVVSFISDFDRQKWTTRHHEIETSFPQSHPGDIFRISVSPLKNKDGEELGKIIITQKITGQKTAEETQQTFINNVAHEFLTPLTTINSYMEMLVDGEIGDKEIQKEFYNTITEEVRRLSSFIQNLLNVSKIEMGGLTLQTGLVKTDWLIEDCAQAVEKNAQEKNITFTKKVPDKFPGIMGDKELLKTAIINILGNAVKYTPENGTIVFSMADHDDHVTFSVSDTGHGISEDELPRVFEKFYRSKDPDILKQNGSGLGLSMTSEIIQLHGGHITVESEVKKGSEFTITLPKEKYYLEQTA